MYNAYILLNHTLTPKQKKELKERFEIENIFAPPPKLAKHWSNVPTSEEIPQEFFTPIIKYLSNAEKGDVIIIQGEFGATFAIVNWALKRKLKVLHSVTKRIAKESKRGERIERHYIFEHIRFRGYKKI